MLARLLSHPIRRSSVVVLLLLPSTASVQIQTPTNPSSGSGSAYKLPSQVQENLDRSRRESEAIQANLDALKRKQAEQAAQQNERFRQSQAKSQQEWDAQAKRNREAAENIGKSMSSSRNLGGTPLHPVDTDTSSGITRDSRTGEEVSDTSLVNKLARLKSQRSRVAQGRMIGGHIPSQPLHFAVDTAELARLDNEIASLEKSIREENLKASSLATSAGGRFAGQSSGDTTASSQTRDQRYGAVGGSESGSASSDSSVNWTFSLPVPDGKSSRNGVWMDRDGNEIESRPMSPAEAAAWRTELSEWRTENDLYYKRIANQEGDEWMLKKRAISEWEDLYKSGAVTWEEHPGRQANPLEYWLEKKKEMDVKSATALVEVGLSGHNFVADTEKYVQVLANRYTVEKQQFGFGERGLVENRIVTDIELKNKVEMLRYTASELSRIYGTPATTGESHIDQVLTKARSDYWQKEGNKLNYVPDHAKDIGK